MNPTDRVHRLFVAVLDKDGRSMREISESIEKIPDLCPRVLYHDWRSPGWAGGPTKSLEEMTAAQFHKWFIGLGIDPDGQSPVSSQTAVSLINLARPGTPGRDWLIEHVVPVLKEGHLYEAQAIIAEKREFDGRERPVLANLVFDIINDVLVRQERAGPCSPEISP